MNNKIRIGIALILALIAGGVVANWGHQMTYWQGLLTVAVLLATLTAGVAWFIYCFTGAACQKRTQTIVFAYFFPKLKLFYVLYGIYDVSRHRPLTGFVLRQYLVGNGVGVPTVR